LTTKKSNPKITLEPANSDQDISPAKTMGSSQTSAQLKLAFDLKSEWPAFHKLSREN
jgi:hypothetical protein